MPGRQKILNPYTLRAPSRYDDIERLDDGQPRNEGAVPDAGGGIDAQPPSAALQPASDRRAD